MSNSSNRWRTVDIVVASVIAAAFGVVFWAWNLLWGATDAAFAFFPPVHAVIYGVWLVPGVLAGLIIRKPGAALYAETLAAIISALLGNAWGTTVIPQGLLQGFGAELAFLATGYRSFRLPVAVLSGLLAGLAAGLWDTFVYYAANELWAFRVPMIVITALSAAVIAGAGGWALTRALAATGVLDRFPSGRDRAPV
ncbi:ECF transporter S component [Catenuloplanes atrovinosus]|uniref:Energy-coupling factor transport system substrate-specific component n=1 Tax=Catenuloplanes atrovinosus TaxID=137266 RepID=A0AAE3YRK8_9ACTN|nr:ECF transporter S component [Catenuloplanes atrovinosus]MDR7278584.1 energy-coupling factor transport system substrate-specific component [Catenuloplanes atrovinosus]